MRKTPRARLVVAVQEANHIRNWCESTWKHRVLSEVEAMADRGIPDLARPSWQQGGPCSHQCARPHTRGRLRRRDTALETASLTKLAAGWRRFGLVPSGGACIVARPCEASATVAAVRWGWEEMHASFHRHQTPKAPQHFAFRIVFYHTRGCCQVARTCMRHDWFRGDSLGGLFSCFVWLEMGLSGVLVGSPSRWQGVRLCDAVRQWPMRGRVGLV